MLKRLMHTRSVWLLALCGVISACSMDAPNTSSSGASSNVNMRDVVGDFCPPAHATKGNC